jgi:hypothetical protein
VRSPAGCARSQHARGYHEEFIKPAKKSLLGLAAVVLAASVAYAPAPSQTSYDASGGCGVDGHEPAPSADAIAATTTPATPARANHRRGRSDAHTSEDGECEFVRRSVHDTFG